MNANEKTMSIKIYTEAAVKIINALLKKIYDDYQKRYDEWRHQPSRWTGYGYSRDTKPRRPMLYKTFACAKRGTTGEVVLVPEQYARNAWRYDEKKLANSLGWELFGSLPEDARGDIKKRAAIDTVILDAKGSEVACLAEILIGRDPKKLAKHYGQSTVDALVGKPDNFLVVEQRKTIQNEIERLRKENELAIQNIRDEFSRIWSQISKERDLKITQTNEEFKAKIEEMNARLRQTM